MTESGVNTEETSDKPKKEKKLKFKAKKEKKEPKAKKEKKPKKKAIKKSAFIRASESQLTDKFGTSVNITEGKKGNGHLAIDFASTDELNRILDLLGINLDK